MKKRRNINFFVGIILIVLNLLVDMVNPDQLDPNSKDNEYNIGYYIGSHFIAITGLILLIIAYRYHRKIKSKEDIELEDTIDNIGK
jgi:presenilin-like A22 family membrane protease